MERFESSILRQPRHDVRNLSIAEPGRLPPDEIDEILHGDLPNVFILDDRHGPSRDDDVRERWLGIERPRHGHPEREAGAFPSTRSHVSAPPLSALATMLGPAWNRACRSTYRRVGSCWYASHIASRRSISARRSVLVQAEVAMLLRKILETHIPEL